ncbi:Gfo/Idh/MocA family protein [Paenibacillus eucommiae]|uniref:Dehydrogenase n=1 Tax=Paenibacillus eucommiae TaxID=1355755 RepID=A0ABS4IPG9_9BACL|nr:Gfo/Idh/MocA family oxidoreductase [Paenibacillus eucommiae]MBP1989457.1 putative dehydrogenase [Paenibacillus eucommiae]
MGEQWGSRTIKLGVIGLGNRGSSLLQLLLNMKDVEITALSDLYEDRMQNALEAVIAAGQPAPSIFKSYEALLAQSSVEAVIIATSWTSHLPITIAAMKAGKYVGSEVGGASSLEECWQLVHTAEETGKRIMLLENCCYGREELALLNMVRQGIFGELIHCQGAYEHDLRDEVALGVENRHYRIHNYKHRNGDVYPTHALGPVAKCLNINYGNRFVKLSSMASKTRGIQLWAQTHLGADHPSSKTNFQLGDIVTTMIQCAQGETILLTHDTSLPRPYSRGGRIQGTKGIWMEDGNVIHLEDTSQAHAWESFDRYKEQYEHPIWQEYLELGVQEGHGGIDYLCLRAFITAVSEQTIPPIDVYDMAAWMAITVLSEQSIQLGGSAVAFPDFTNGQWIERTSESGGKYAL